MRFLFVIFCFFMMSVPIKAQDYASQYNEVTFNGFADLFWKYNVYDVNDGDAVDSYLKLTNCGLFQKYYEDDFLWQIITQGFKRDLSYFASSIPNKYVVTAVMPIERYDFEKSAFIIDPRVALDNAGAIQIPFYQEIQRVCGSEFVDAKYFPVKMKFVGDRKFSLKEIPMNSRDANALLDRIRKNYNKQLESNRVVYLRFLITISGVEDFEIDSKSPEIIFNGTLDELAFFEDPFMTKMIWNKQFRLFE